MTATDSAVADNTTGRQPSASAAAGDIVQYKGEFEIYPSQHLAHLDQGPLRAYAVRSARAGGTGYSHFALVCDPALVPRRRAAPKLASIINPALLRVTTGGPVYWPPAGAERTIFIYENTLGVPLMTADNMTGLGWKPERVINTVVRPMIAILREMRDRDLVHGNIRPTNFYVTGATGSERVVLGDCLGTPTGYLQPVTFETIERAMADPIARGTGTPDDDLYAFGVTLTCLLRTRDPLEGMSNDEIIKEKMNLGSYAALTGKERFTGGILELLRGLLYDDRNQRWTLDEIEAWEQGQRLSPKQPARRHKASRPIHFNDDRYFRPNTLAMDLGKNPAETVQIVENDSLQQWVTRSLEEKLIGERLKDAITDVQENGQGPHFADRMVSRVSIALDPEAPIRYAGMRFHPEGFPVAMAQAYISKKSIQPFVDILNQGLVMVWLSQQNDVRLDVGGLNSRYDGCRSFLRQTAMGYGLERCLYFLCGELHCLSDKLTDYCVTSPEELLHAYEDLAKKPSRPESFIDRHIAAFLSIKDRRMIDPYLQDLNAPEPHRRLMAGVKVLATIQKRSRMENFPAITGWIADIIKPAYNRFHDRELREKMAKRVEKMKNSGDISRIAALLDNHETLQDDFNEFRLAMREYGDLRVEAETLRSKIDRSENYGRDTGHEVAAIFSGVLAGVLVLVCSFLFFTKGWTF